MRVRALVGSVALAAVTATWAACPPPAAEFQETPPVRDDVDLFEEDPPAPPYSEPAVPDTPAVHQPDLSDPPAP